MKNLICILMLYALIQYCTSRSWRPRNRPPIVLDSTDFENYYNYPSNLSHMNYYTIKEGTFSHYTMKKCRILLLYNNLLSQLDEDVFFPLWKMEELNLSKYISHFLNDIRFLGIIKLNVKYQNIIKNLIFQFP